MDREWLKSTATVLAVAAIVLVLVDAALTLRNQGAQSVVNERQQYINQGAEVSRVAQLLAQTIARTAIDTKDTALSALLQRHGLQLSHTAPDVAAPEEKTPDMATTPEEKTK